MSSLQISQGTFRLSDTKTLKIDHLRVTTGESWAFVGSNGSGKSALARALAGDLTLLSGQRESQFSRVTRLSFEQLQKLVSDEWQRNNTDLLSPGEEDTGRTTAEIIQDEVKDPARCAQLAEQFGISALLNRRFKYLSTGETRKTLLCQALMSDPQLLILDEPFDGLDVSSRQQLAALLADLHRAGITLVLVLNRFDEIPEFVQFAGVLADCTLIDTGATSSLLQQRWWPSWRTVKNWTVSACRSRMSRRPGKRWQTQRRESCSMTAWSPITIARSSTTFPGP